MHPILFNIPGLDFMVRSFGVLVAAGFLFGSFLLGRLSKSYGDDPEGDPDRYARITVWILVGVIAGARLMYVVVEVAKELALSDPDSGSVGRMFIEEPWRALFIWEGGLVMYGGFLGAVFLGMMSAKREKVRPIHALDLGLIAGFIGQGIGRVGCLLVGDDHGSIVPKGSEGLPFPIALKVPNPLPEESLFDPSVIGETIWATQPWMTINALLIAAIGFMILRKRRYVGQVSLWIFFLYSITRYAIESFRGDAVRGMWFDNSISTSQLIAIVTGLISAGLLFSLRKKKDEAFNVQSA